MTFCTWNAVFRGIDLGVLLRFQLSWQHCGGVNEESFFACGSFDEHKLFCLN